MKEQSFFSIISTIANIPEKLSNRWKKDPIWQGALEGFVASILISILTILGFSPFESFNKEWAPPPTITKMLHPIISFLTIIILVPFFETLIFNSLLKFLFFQSKFLRNNTLIVIVLAGLIFGAVHFYSVAYIFQMTFVGMFFMYLYLLRDKRGDGLLVVWAVHGLRNCIPFTIELLKKANMLNYEILCNQSGFLEGLQLGR